MHFFLSRDIIHLAFIVDAVEKKYLLLFNLCGDSSPHRPRCNRVNDKISCLNIFAVLMPREGGSAMKARKSRSGPITIKDAAVVLIKSEAKRS